MAFVFQRAVRQQRDARIGIIGPSGSGKTYTALQIAKGLAGPNGRIAVIDTENYSSSLYADLFDFDVLNLETFAPQIYTAAIRAAEQAGYDVLVIDSLSHAWAGKDGALEQVDRAAARSRSGNTFAAWREVTPAHNTMVDTIVRANLHVIATMRAKTEYIIEQVTRNGRTVHEPRKIGLAPVQRDGMEYEFDIVADMDWDHRFIVSKSRASFLADAVLDKPGPELGEQIRAWLDSGEAVQPTSASEPRLATRPTVAANGNGQALPAKDARAEALAAYHEAATPLFPDEEERIEFLRFAAWTSAKANWQGDGLLPLPEVAQIGAGMLTGITKRLADLDMDSARALLEGWKGEYSGAAAGNALEPMHAEQAALPV